MGHLKKYTPIGFISLLIADEIPDGAAYATWDYKIHNVGQVEQVITNMGYLGFHCPVPGGHIQQKCVYPKGSNNSFLYSGLFLSSINSALLKYLTLSFEKVSAMKYSSYSCFK